ncbi:hypothetical protein ONS95_014683 [Cadophora gregata]|uniref:uncharacterized protein n=1 Tax=Cadophora gregata TaxID=51156 RepID=UPI0026DC8172|nr:uncharacterized protein ONS95_014683 [Cadophora gregata]KAK0112969.1 hypothetical protein ONS95_014683 [Cadophora gregata]KAK0125092.1 hypothetical protein ONS96_008958 [Cadophora gregata f. sp. sojae]
MKALSTLPITSVLSSIVTFSSQAFSETCSQFNPLLPPHLKMEYLMLTLGRQNDEVAGNIAKGLLQGPRMFGEKVNSRDGETIPVHGLSPKYLDSADLYISIEGTPRGLYTKE